MNITEDKVTEYICSFYRPMDERLAALRRQSEEDAIPLILPETEMLFRTLFRLNPPKRILEIGTAYGYSAIFLATLLPDCYITTIESSEENARIASDNVQEQGLTDRIEILEGDAVPVMNGLRRCGIGNPKCYDAVFIDASKSHYREFFDIAESLSTEDAMILCDNILMKGFLTDPSLDRNRRHHTSIRKMRSFLQYLYSREDLDVSLVPCGDGLVIAKRKENR